MSQGIQRTGIAFRLAIFLARNPDEELLTEDLILKFDVQRTDNLRSLDAAVRSGLITREAGQRGRGHQHVYRAGPALLALIGHNTPTTCNAAQA